MSEQTIPCDPAADRRGSGPQWTFVPGPGKRAMYGPLKFGRRAGYDSAILCGFSPGTGLDNVLGSGRFAGLSEAAAGRPPLPQTP